MHFFGLAKEPPWILATKRLVGLRVMLIVMNMNHTTNPLLHIVQVIIQVTIESIELPWTLDQPCPSIVNHSWELCSASQVDSRWLCSLSAHALLFQCHQVPTIQNTRTMPTSWHYVSDDITQDQMRSWHDTAWHDIHINDIKWLTNSANNTSHATWYHVNGDISIHTLCLFNKPFFWRYYVYIASITA